MIKYGEDREGTEAPLNVSVVPLRGYLKGKWFCWFQYPHRKPACMLASQFLHPFLLQWSCPPLPSLLEVLWLSSVRCGDPTAKTVPTHKLFTPHMHVIHLRVHSSLCNSPLKHWSSDFSVDQNHLVGLLKDTAQGVWFNRSGMNLRMCTHKFLDDASAAGVGTTLRTA